MSNTSAQYYHFAWNETDQTPATQPPDVTARERVARILRETELKEVPDIVFRSSGDARPPTTSDASNARTLRDDSQLFSIDDADWSSEEVNNDEDDVTDVPRSRDVSNAAATGADEQLLRVPPSSIEHGRQSKTKPNSKG